MSEMGFVHGFEKECLKYRGFSPSVMEELNQKMTCVNPKDWFPQLKGRTNLFEDSWRTLDATIVLRVPGLSDTFIVAALDRSLIKMVKIQVTGVSSFEWKGAKYNPVTTHPDKCSNETNFSMDCWSDGGVSKAENQLSVKLLAGTITDDDTTLRVIVAYTGSEASPEIRQNAGTYELMGKMQDGSAVYVSGRSVILIDSNRDGNWIGTRTLGIHTESSTWLNSFPHCKEKKIENCTQDHWQIRKNKNGHAWIYERLTVSYDLCTSKNCKHCTATFADPKGNRYLYIAAVKISDSTYVFGHAHEGVLRMMARIYDNDNVTYTTKDRFIKTAHHGDVVVTAEKWDKGEDGIGNVGGNWDDITMDCI